MTRLFIMDLVISDDKISLDKENSHYIASVLRMREGEELVIVDKDRIEYYCEVAFVDKNSVIVEVKNKKQNDTEPKCHITLYQSVSKGERMDLTIQKSVELGVSRIVPVFSERCIVRSDKLSKIDRWQKIALEAARQSQRGIIPEITEPMTFDNALKKSVDDNNDVVLFPWEEAQGKTLKDVVSKTTLNKVSIFIGPEGGYSVKEADKAKDMGIVPVTLGKRILRTETAGPAVLAMLLFETEL